MERSQSFPILFFPALVHYYLVVEILALPEEVRFRAQFGGEMYPAKEISRRLSVSGWVWGDLGLACYPE